MPFINSKVTVALTEEQREGIKAKLGQAITCIPGKSEHWLMVGFDENYSLYFRGENCEKAAFVDVKICGSSTREAYDNLTREICNIFEEELQIPGDKIYITYQEVEHWGFEGKNF